MAYFEAVMKHIPHNGGNFQSYNTATTEHGHNGGVAVPCWIFL